eukprot:CAMPEP_0185728522 /NCGR_PEP_ID=MMETSP1171-20130828/3824_1 /TAXON_ID=374046 /ORGANISM="Helicotheca tamensis, Strain CCMP826" /LENGTH=203 /DNA_ID=CAMNT_0028397237 /DNA_START=106 /DNA_END=717 /DNA_ORIENTATION=+
MKVSLLLVASTIVSTGAFAPSAHSQQRVAQTELSMTSGGRREFAKSAAASVFGVVATTAAFPENAFAKDYEPKFDDLKQIYGLGVSLDRLNEKVSDPDKWGAALEGLRAFNRDPNFYGGYARNYISKSVKNNADGDERVGYIRQASNVIGSCQELLEGRQGLDGADAAAEASKRVKRAQGLIAKFLGASGVEDERVAAFVSAH